MNSNEETVAEAAVAKGGNRQMGPMAENSGGNSSGNSTTPPAKPTDSEGNEIEMGEPPEMNCDSEDETCEPPEMPEEFDGEMPSDMRGGGFGGRGEMMTAQSVNSDAVWHPVAYLAMGGCSVILGILVSYACFSKFFRSKPGQTFATASRFIWFIVVAVLVAVGLSALGFFIPKWVG